MGPGPSAAPGAEGWRQAPQGASLCSGLQGTRPGPVQELVACSLWASSTGRRPTRPGPPQALGGAAGDRKPVELPALLYLDIPEPRGSAWPAAGPERAATEGRESQTGNPPEGTDAGSLGAFVPSDRNVRAKGCRGQRACPRAPQQAPGCRSAGWEREASRGPAHAGTAPSHVSVNGTGGNTRATTLRAEPEHTLRRTLRAEHTRTASDPTNRNARSEQSGRI